MACLGVAAPKYKSHENGYIVLDIAPQFASAAHMPSKPYPEAPWLVLGQAISNSKRVGTLCIVPQQNHFEGAKLSV